MRLCGKAHNDSLKIYFSGTFEFSNFSIRETKQGELHRYRRFVDVYVPSLKSIGADIQ